MNSLAGNRTLDFLTPFANLCQLRKTLENRFTMTFLSYDALVGWSISLGKYLPKNQYLTCMDRIQG